MLCSEEGDKPWPFTYLNAPRGRFRGEDIGSGVARDAFAHGAFLGALMSCGGAKIVTLPG
jgi:hypothetical protein